MIEKLFSLIDEKAVFSVVFVSLDEITRLNETYRAKPYPTDVLSFPTEGEIVGDLGDIFIAPARAIEQAKEYGHSEMREYLFLTVHGYLHLQGYDHQNSDEEKIMMAKTESILALVNLDKETICS